MQGSDLIEQEIRLEPLNVFGTLTLPAKDTRNFVVFAHGSGSSRHSPRNRYVASMLNQAGFATLLMDLMTQEEEAVEQFSGHLRFNIDFLAGRLVGATDWLELFCAGHLTEIKVAYFGASTGAAAALAASIRRPGRVKAIVSRGGRPDLAGHNLEQVTSPVLFLVGEKDFPVIPLNQSAFDQIKISDKKMEIIPGASHLFEEPGTLEQAARLACNWFEEHFKE